MYHKHNIVLIGVTYWFIRYYHRILKRATFSFDHLLHFLSHIGSDLRTKKERVNIQPNCTLGGTLGEIP